jgi:hypothetical protein
MWFKYIIVKTKTLLSKSLFMVHACNLNTKDVEEQGLEARPAWAT